MTNPRIRRRRARVLRWIERGLLLAGVVAVGIWIWSMASRAVFQDWENWAFDRELRGERATASGYLWDKESRVAAGVRGWLGMPAGPAPPAPPGAIAPAERSHIENNGVVGRLLIPRLRLSAMIREGVGENTLRVALGHIPGTALPGQTGNVGVAGHRDTLFRSLANIRDKDLIQFETPSGNYTYEVEKTEIVKPRNVSVLKARQYPELTLVTCYPFYYVGSAPDRFIVKARQLLHEQKLPETVAGSRDAKREAPTPPAPAGRNTHRENRAARYVPVGNRLDRDAAGHRIPFELGKGHSRQLAPGISLGLTDTDADYRSVDGWMWVLPERRTIWLHDQRVQQHVVFYSYLDGRKRELVITGVTPNSMRGYLVVP